MSGDRVRGHDLQLVREQVEQQPVLPDPFRVAPVAAKDADTLEPHRFIRADRRLVREGRVDRQPVVPALVDQPPSECPHGVAAEALAVQHRREEEVDVGVLELVFARLGELRQSDDLAVVLDRE